MESRHRVSDAASRTGAVLAGLLAAYMEIIFMCAVGMSIDDGEIGWAAIGIVRGIVPVVVVTIAWNRARGLPSSQRALNACGSAAFVGYLLIVVSFFVGLVWT
jgi:hypothetical protein